MAPAQAAQPTRSTVPASAEASDKAHALLDAALKINGLASDDLKPWHLKATYSFSNGTKGPDIGTMEVWTVGRHQWRRSYTGKLYHGTVWSMSRTHLYHTRDATEMTFSSVGIGPRLLDPLSRAPLIKPGYEVDLKRVNGGVALNCVAVVRPERYLAHTSVANLIPSYCFDESGRLRLDARGHYVRQFDNYRLFQARAVAGSLKFIHDG